MSKQTNKPLALALGAALVGGLALSASAFAMTDLASGYMLAAAGEQAATRPAKASAAWRRWTPTRTARSRRPSSPPRTRATTSKFAAHDTNKDGFITADEMKAHRREWKASAAKASAAKASAAATRRRPTWKASAAKASAAAWPELIA